MAVGFRTLRWRLLLSHLKSIPTTRLFPVVVVGYMANNLSPARRGELVRSYYLSRRERCSASAALATIAVLMRWLRRVSFTPLVIYRLALGGALLWMVYA